MPKRKLGKSVYEAAQERIEYVFDNFPQIYVSFSGGKDSTAMLHMIIEEAKDRGRTVGVLFVDLEAQYKLTIEHLEHCFDLYSEHIDPYWVSLPLSLRNAVSQYEPQWQCWNPDKEEMWVRQPPDYAITDPDYFPFFVRGMEFEDFVDEFGVWYGGGDMTACMVGIRADESLNRFRTLAARKQKLEGKQWTTYLRGTVFNCYPIYDWKTQDVWIYHGKTGKPYNRLYDRMYQAGLSIHQSRICQPYGDDQRKGLWLYHVIEPETWGKVVARVNGANHGAKYARVRGNIMGQQEWSLPEGHTWESFSKMLLASMPDKTREHYMNKISVFLRWWEDRGYENGIPDYADKDKERNKDAPSWRRIAKVLLRHDYWCKGLSFSQHRSGAYEKYRKRMIERRKRWDMMKPKDL